jgi:hypothetical protein
MLNSFQHPPGRIGKVNEVDSRRPISPPPHPALKRDDFKLIPAPFTVIPAKAGIHWR